MTKQEIEIKFTKIDGQIEALDRHEKQFKARLDNIDVGLLDLNLSMKQLLVKMDKIPEKVHAMELEKAENRYLNSVVKPVIIFVIGMVSQYVFNNMVVANREEKQQYKKEVKQ